jgi:hypothetical protein
MAAIGMERLKTNAFQFDMYAFPGSARKLILLTNVAKIDMPTIHDGNFPPPDVKWSDVLLFQKKLAPNITFPNVIIIKTMRSSTGSFMSYVLIVLE